MCGRHNFLTTHALISLTKVQHIIGSCLLNADDYQQTTIDISIHVKCSVKTMLTPFGGSKLFVIDFYRFYS